MVHLAGISSALAAHPLPPALEPSGAWARTVDLEGLPWAKSPFLGSGPKQATSEATPVSTSSFSETLPTWTAARKRPSRGSVAALPSPQHHRPALPFDRCLKKTASCILFTHLQLFSEDTPGIRCSILARCRSLRRVVQPHRIRCKFDIATFFKKRIMNRWKFISNVSYLTKYIQRCSSHWLINTQRLEVFYIVS